MTFNHRVTSLSLSAWPAVSVGGNKLQMMFRLLLLHVLLVLWCKGIRLNLRKNKKQKHKLKQRGSSLPPGKTYECWIMQQIGVLYNHVLLSTHTLHIHSVTDGGTYPKLLISKKLVVCVHHFRAAGKEKGKAGKLQLDHNHRGHSGAISFPVQSHNPMAQTFALIRHLGNTSIPFHFISSNQSPISIKWIHWEQKSGWARYYYQREVLHYSLLWLLVFPL